MHLSVHGNDKNELSFVVSVDQHDQHGKTILLVPIKLYNTEILQMSIWMSKPGGCCGVQLVISVDISLRYGDHSLNKLLLSALRSWEHL